jgi:hypothetical protein
MPAGIERRQRTVSYPVEVKLEYTVFDREHAGGTGQGTTITVSSGAAKRQLPRVVASI